MKRFQFAMIGIFGKTILTWAYLNAQRKPSLWRLHRKAERSRSEEPVLSTWHRHAHKVNVSIGLRREVNHLIRVRLRIESGQKMLPRPEESRSPARLSGIVA